MNGAENFFLLMCIIGTQSFDPKEVSRAAPVSFGGKYKKDQTQMIAITILFQKV